jgi:hypothetical protein
LDALATEVTTELWGPSPIYPVPIRPGKWTLEFRVQGGKEGYPSTKMGRSGLSLGQGVHREMKSEGARRRCSLTSS